MTAPALDPKVRGHISLIGWTWLIHGVLLLITPLSLLGLDAMFRLIANSGVLQQMEPRERAEIEHMSTAMEAYLVAIPWVLGLGIVIIPLAICFLKRVTWSRSITEVMTWLHLVIVFPGMWWFLLAAPPLSRQFDSRGEPIPGTDWILHISHSVTTLAMMGFAIFLLVLTRKPALKAAFSGTVDTPADEA